MIYNLIIYLYLLGVAIYSRFNEKVRKMWRGEREAFKILREKVDPNAKYVWFHAASLGEFEQGRPLMEQLRKEHPEYKILLTFFSPSGYEVRKNYEGADIITYLPLDTITNARRFLRTIRPVMAFIVMCQFIVCLASSAPIRCSSSGMVASMGTCSTVLRISSCRMNRARICWPRYTLIM